MTRLPAIFALCLSLAACGGNDSGTTTTTKLDAVEVQPGTISDAMITLDDTDIDGTAVVNRVPADDTAKVEKKDEEGASDDAVATDGERSEEHTSELQSLMRSSYAVFCLKKKKKS